MGAGAGAPGLDPGRVAQLRIETTADRIGYESLYLPEVWEYDSTLIIAELATCTRRIQLGSGILGIRGRTAATMDMADAT